jgi:hypothetical protein
VLAIIFAPLAGRCSGVVDGWTDVSEAIVSRNAAREEAHFVGPRARCPARKRQRPDRPVAGERIARCTRRYSLDHFGRAATLARYVRC